MQITPELLERYTKGECSKDEIALVENWMDIPEEDEQILKGVPFSDSLEQRLRNNIRKHTSGEFPKMHKTGNNSYRWFIAASIVLLLGISPFFYMGNHNVDYKTGAGEIKTVTLADGSTVTLNAMSELTVHKKFGNTRTLELQGEAFFKVAKDSLHPFIVNTVTSRTKVLGTEFNLTAYQNETVKLTLQEGKVHFSKKGQNQDGGIVLEPGEQVALENGTLIKKEVDHTISRAWMVKKLVFKSVPFDEVCKEIERFYGISIDIRKKGLHKRLYRGTHDNPSLSDIIQKMGFVLKFKYKMEGSTLIIY